MYNQAMVKQPWCVCIPFVAGDASKTIKAAPGASNRLVILKTAVIITTSAAQAIAIGTTANALIAQQLAASAAIGTYLGPNLEVGFQLGLNEALLYTPAAAGPAGMVIAEGYIESAG